MNWQSITVPQIVNCGVYDSRFIYKNREMSKTRTVSMFELELPIEECGVSYFENVPYPVKLQNFIVAKPGNVRHTALHYKCYYIHMTVEKGELYDLLMSLPEVLPVTDREKYMKLFEDMITAEDLPYEEKKLITSARLLEMLFMLKKDGVTASLGMFEKRSNAEIITKALDFINNNYHHEITLESVADSVHMSRIYFHNLFKSAVGQTVHRYILNKRMEEAKRRLLSTTDSIGEIAMLSGFSSQSYFNYIFRKETGMTPGQYKEKMSMDYLI